MTAARGRSGKNRKNSGNVAPIDARIPQVNAFRLFCSCLSKNGANSDQTNPGNKSRKERAKMSDEQAFKSPNEEEEERRKI